MKRLISILLSANAGYVDTAGFIALNGLFAAHITGNFVTLGMALVSSTPEVWTKILALPTFCIVVFVSKLLAAAITRTSFSVIRSLLFFKIFFLIAAAILAISINENNHSYSIVEIFTGLLLVAAMALQNSISCLYPNPVPATILTGPLTRMMIDVGDLTLAISPDQSIVKDRLVVVLINVGSFAFGCVFSAFLFSRVGTWFFIVPPILAFIPMILGQKGGETYL